MKVLELTDADVFAGTERHILELAGGLAIRSVEVAVGCPADSPLARSSAEQAIRVVEIEKGGTLDRQAIRLIADELKSGRIDLVHAHNGRTAWLAALARMRAGRGHVLSTMHFIDPTRSTRTGIKRLLSNAIHTFTRWQSSGLIAISDVVRDAAIARGDEKPGRVWRVYNGVSKPDFQRDRHQIRDGLGIDPDRPVLISAIRLEKEKSADVLIDAAYRLKANDGVAPFTWLIAGAGSMQEPLQAMIDRSHLQDHVRLLGFRGDVHELMAAADVLVHPAVAEPFGLVLAEAMALGLPVIASDGGAAPEVVVHDQTGWLFKAGDPESLAAQIAQALADLPKCQAYGRAGLRRYEQLFTADQMVAHTHDVYHRVLSHSSHGRSE